MPDEDGVSCIASGADYVTLQVSKSGIWGPPTAVEVWSDRGWFGGTWEPAAKIECVQVGNPGGGVPTFCITLLQLLPNSETKIRLFWSGRATPLFCTCQTTGPPPVLEAPCLRGRTPTTLMLDIEVPNPSGTEILECQLDYCKDSIFSQWESAIDVVRISPAFSSSSSASASCTLSATSDPGTPEIWRTRIQNLLPSTEYLFRARARNGAGWSEVFSPVLRAKTSAFPPEPRRLRVLTRRPGGVTVEAEVEDTDGANTTHLQAEILSLLQWHSLGFFAASRDFSEGQYQPCVLASQRSVVPGTSKWTVDLETLPSGVDVSVRFWSINEVGYSLQPSNVLVCRPSERPKAIANVRCVSRWATQLEVEWEVVDPEGAPILECACQYGRYHVVMPWHDAAASAIHRSAVRSNLWRARLEGLERETCYQVRVRARNEVGWSDDAPSSSLPQFWTAESPAQPANLRCLRGGLKEVDIAFELEVDKAQVRFMAPISQIVVEQAGLLVWTRVPAEQVKLHMSPPQSCAAARDGSSGEVAVVNSRVLISGLAPATHYVFRIWVANDIGWSRFQVPTLRCHTAMPPEAPSLIGNITLSGSHSAEIQWSVDDPAEAPVLECEVEIRENSVFSAWRPARGVELQHPDRVLGAPTGGCDHPPQWAQRIDGLVPQQEFCLRIRARNAVDLSKWSIEHQFKTPSPPSIQKCWVAPAVEGHGLPLGPKTRMVVVNVELQADLACPALLVTVAEKVAGSNTSFTSAATVCTFAGKTGATTWQACLPVTTAHHLPTTFGVRAANAVGWTSTLEIREETSSEEKICKEAEEGAYRPVSSFLHHLLELEVSRSNATGLLLTKLLKHARATGDARRARRLECRASVATRWARVLAALGAEEASASVSPSSDICSKSFGEGWGRQVAECRGESQERAREERLGLLAAEGFEAVAKLALSIEVIALKVIEPLAGQIWSRLSASRVPRFFEVWQQEQQGWTPRFHQSLRSVWQSAAYLLVKLTTVVTDGGPLGEAEALLPTSLAALFSLRESAEAQLRKLKRVEHMLEQVTSEGGESHDFAQISVADKLSSTAFTLLLSAVLPVPGSLEIGAFSIGALWLEGDSAGKHAILEHPRTSGADVPTKRFRQTPTAEGRQLWKDWAEGRAEHSLLVHNATARMVTIRVLRGNESLWRKAYVKLQQAHPYARWVTSAMERYFVDSYLRADPASSDTSANSESSTLPVVTVAPAGVASLPLPQPPTPPPEDDGSGAAAAFAAAAAHERLWEVEFAYGVGDRAERAVGRAPASSGSAVSFVCVDHEARVDNDLSEPSGESNAGDNHTSCNNVNSNAAGNITSNGNSSGDAGGNNNSNSINSSTESNSNAGSNAGTSFAGEQESIECFRVAVRNADFSKVNVNFYYPSNHIRIFERAVVTASIGVGEVKRINIPFRERDPAGSQKWNGLSLPGRKSFQAILPTRSGPEEELSETSATASASARTSAAPCSALEASTSTLDRPGSERLKPVVLVNRRSEGLSATSSKMDPSEAAAAAAQAIVDVSDAQVADLFKAPVDDRHEPRDGPEAFWGTAAALELATSASLEPTGELESKSKSKLRAQASAALERAAIGSDEPREEPDTFLETSTDLELAASERDERRDEPETCLEKFTGELPASVSNLENADFLAVPAATSSATSAANAAASAWATSAATFAATPSSASAAAAASSSPAAATLSVASAPPSVTPAAPPDAQPATNAGTPSENETVWDESNYLEVEIIDAQGKKTWCNAVDGQLVIYEGCI